MSETTRIAWDALDSGGYGPRGREDDFRSRCPGHDGSNPTSLHVWDNGGVAMLYCHAHGCSVEDITEPLGLRVRDLFPVTLGDSGRRLRSARREEFTGNARTVVNLLGALDQLGERWAVALWLDECPNCERQHVQLAIGSAGEPRYHCDRGCDLPLVGRALADRIADRGRRAA